MRAVIANVVGMLLLSSSTAEALDMTDVPKIQSTYSANQARFTRDYKGKPFTDRIKVKAVIEHPLSRGQYMVQFGAGGLFGDVACTFSEKKQIELVTDLNPGDLVRVTGTVVDHVMGAVTLSNCTLAPGT